MAEGNAEIKSFQAANLCLGLPCNILKLEKWHFRAMDALSQEYTFKSLSQNMKNHQTCYMCASTLIHIVFI